MPRKIYGTNELWSHLSESKKPILLYGMGNGADKIISVLHKKGLNFADVFASDDFVRGQFFHGKRVLTLSEAEEKYRDFIILVSFGTSLPEVMKKIHALSEKHELYAPDVPVAGEEIFDADFFAKNEEEIFRAREILSDERSKEIYDELIRYKLDGNISHFKNTDRRGGLFSKKLSGGYNVYCDLGAYTGDTADEALLRFPTIRRVIAFEPSEKVFCKLSKNVKKHESTDFTLINACAFSHDEEITLSDGEGRNSAITEQKDISKTASGAKIKTVIAKAPDGYMNFSGEALLMKFDVEGAEREAIEGSKNAIKNNLTELCVALYHRSEDIFSLPLLIHEILPHHALFIEKTDYIPAWEINLYACVRNTPKNSAL